MRLLGVDPGLRYTGWGVVECVGNRMFYRASGIITPDVKLPMGQRLWRLHEGLWDVITQQNPHEVAVEETFVNTNPATSLRLGQARGVILMTPARAGLVVAEYSALRIKQAVVGTGRASKEQVAQMVTRLLPGASPRRSDEADALAVAICHAHHRQAPVQAVTSRASAKQVMLPSQRHSPVAPAAAMLARLVAEVGRDSGKATTLPSRPRRRKCR
ncbi:crossover junction endodeoxyribonuclease RuvC [Formicincola oecophyllae]|uniref:Crossover junction endodeoxyribonuclease RuvC n=1 Tax=Formicincola oecophyllae TaxID=2558361 RepID=A0A4Y6UDE0_9PROT|nr:crossover junction endodeoxyribonuclease RuvC [Formicincola oecophyllae]